MSTNNDADKSDDARSSSSAFVVGEKDVKPNRYEPKINNRIVLPVTALLTYVTMQVVDPIDPGQWLKFCASISILFDTFDFIDSRETLKMCIW